MHKIKHLSKDIIAKIAAGEVIERPSYAVKELTENAIDAKADTIEINIEDSGLKKITVSDNGEGMSNTDLQICFLPHTTSKIVDDLHPHGVKTLGFRGEALSSISAISTMTITSREKNEIGGMRVTLHEGNVEHVQPIGVPIGTTVSIENIFHSIPARKKFLKSKQTEFRHITEIVTQFGLSYPMIHFILIHNDKTVLDLPKKRELSQRVTTLLGSTISDQLFPLMYEDSYITLHGFIGHPQIASKQQKKQFLFINNRSVSDRLISLAVKESYGTLIPSTNTPLFLLYLTVPEEIVDVNIHPRKEQVSFLNSQEVFTAIKLAVTETLTQHNITFTLAKFKEENSARTGETTSFSSSLLKRTVFSPGNTIPLKSAKKMSLSQLAATYIICTTSQGICLFDQHALHERILYEEFTDAFENEKNQEKTYVLPRPFTLTLSITDAQVLEEYHEQFEKIGFTIEHFQGTNFVIRSAPTIFKGRKLEKIFMDMIDDLSLGTGLRTIDLKSQRMLAFLSCRAAVKAGDSLTSRQMQDLLRRYEKTKNNATCPHGRPTKIEVSLSELGKMFKRL